MTDPSTSGYELTVCSVTMKTSCMEGGTAFNYRANNLKNKTCVSVERLLPSAGSIHALR